MSKKLLITGGHAGSTAYSLIQEIKRRKPDWKVVFVGAKSSVEGKHLPTLEKTYFPKMGIKYIPLISGRIQRDFTFWTIPSLLKIPTGFISALFILIKEKPSIVISFGGFTAFPVVVAARFVGIPVIIHEQTFSAGRSNILSSYFADKIALARYGSLKYFAKGKCIVVGNPISREVALGMNKKKAMKHNSILIAGGSRGSLFINEMIKPIIPKLIKDFTIYHQTGNQSFAKFEKIRSLMETKYREKYIVFPTVEMWKWYEFLNKADFIISRSGANIVAETAYLNMPSIFIPIPNSYNNEQLENALFAQKLGLARILRQGKLQSEDVYREIGRISRNWKFIVKKSKRPKIDDSQASAKLFKIISEYA